VSARLKIARGVRLEGSGFPIALELEAKPKWGRTWLAEIGAPTTEQDRKFGLARDFLERDGQDVSNAGNGMIQFTIDDPGTYEASAVYRSYGMFRVVFRVTDAGEVELLGDSSEKNLSTLYKKLFPEIGKQADLQASVT
jgi:hypothetical protein